MELPFAVGINTSTELATSSSSILPSPHRIRDSEVLQSQTLSSPSTSSLVIQDDTESAEKGGSVCISIIQGVQQHNRLLPAQRCDFRREGAGPASPYSTESSLVTASSREEDIVVVVEGEEAEGVVNSSSSLIISSSSSSSSFPSQLQHQELHLQICQSSKEDEFILAGFSATPTVSHRINPRTEDTTVGGEEFYRNTQHHHNLHPRNLPRPFPEQAPVAESISLYQATPTIVLLPPLSATNTNTQAFSPIVVAQKSSHSTVPVTTSAIASTSSVASKVTSMFSQFTSRLAGGVLASASMDWANTTSSNAQASVQVPLSGEIQPSSNEASPINGIDDAAASLSNNKGQRITSPSGTLSSGSSSNGDMNASIDFAYVNVLNDEDEVDIWLDNNNIGNGNYNNPNSSSGYSQSGGCATILSEQPKGGAYDTLTILFSGSIQQKHDNHIIISDLEQERAYSNSYNTENINEVPSTTKSTAAMAILQQIIESIDCGNRASTEATDAKTNRSNIQLAMQKHSESAKHFHQAAMRVVQYHPNASMANSLLLLSQTQAKSALALKRVLKMQPTEAHINLLEPAGNPSSNAMHSQQKCDSTGEPSSIVANEPVSQPVVSQKDRLRAKLRGVLNTHNQTEADISESTFLGRATSATESIADNALINKQQTDQNNPALSVLDGSKAGGSTDINPVDEMMELERELRDMDMALEMRASIASLSGPGTAISGNKNLPTMKNSMISSDGSFMVVPSGSSYMSSSVIWGTATAPSQQQNSQQPNPSIRAVGNNAASTANNSNISHHGGPRARANRVQSIGTRQHQHQHQQLILPPSSTSVSRSSHNVVGHAAAGGGLESSWWGNNSTSASQILSSSVISLANAEMQVVGGSNNQIQNSSNHTKQLLRLMDSLKTLGDENASLLREVEGAEAARAEAKAAKEQMRRFKEEYAKRFNALKDALDKFRKEHKDSTVVVGGNANGGGGGIVNPVTSSNYIQTASSNEQQMLIQRQEQLIRKLTADLKKEKEESKKKDAALRKYESFYKEVKARSAQKAAQRQVTLLETTTAAVPKQMGAPPRVGPSYRPSRF